MRIQQAGPVNDRIVLLGSRHICSYLLKGEEYALLGGSVPWEVPRLESQLDEFKVERERIRYLIVSHAHHDHCGAVPYLVTRYPNIRVVVSQYCARVLRKEQAVNLMRDVNRQTLDVLKRPHSFDGYSLEFGPIPVWREVGDLDEIRLGEEMVLRFYVTPGHSRCSLSVYVPSEQALFPGDSVPAPEAGKRELTVTANHDYNDYLNSLRKLEDLSIRLVGYEHGGVLTEEDVEGIIPRSIAATLEQRERIRKRFGELQDLDRLISETAEKFHALELFRLVPSDLMKAITARMVKSALDMV